MPLEGHWARQNTALRRLGRRELRVLVAGVIALSVVLVVVLIAAVRTDAPAPTAGCVDVVAASTTGGATLHACGAEAAHWCRIEAARRDVVARTVLARCRAAGFR